MSLFKRKSSAPILCDGCGAENPEWFVMAVRPSGQKLLAHCDKCRDERNATDEHWLDVWFSYLSVELQEGRKQIHDKELMWALEEAGCDNPKRIRRKAIRLSEEVMSR